MDVFWYTILLIVFLSASSISPESRQSPTTLTPRDMRNLRTEYEQLGADLRHRIDMRGNLLKFLIGFNTVLVGACGFLISHANDPAVPFATLGIAIVGVSSAFALLSIDKRNRRVITGYVLRGKALCEPLGLNKVVEADPGYVMWEKAKKKSKSGPGSHTFGMNLVMWVFIVLWLFVFFYSVRWLLKEGHWPF